MIISFRASAGARSSVLVIGIAEISGGLETGIFVAHCTSGERGLCTLDEAKHSCCCLNSDVLCSKLGHCVVKSVVKTLFEAGNTLGVQICAS
eukprot:958387-Rhodomonas_salina.1